MFFLFYFMKVWPSIPNEGGQVYFLGPAATEHPEQDVLPDDQWNSGPGTGYLSVIMYLLIICLFLSQSLCFFFFSCARAVVVSIPLS